MRFSMHGLGHITAQVGTHTSLVVTKSSAVVSVRRMKWRTYLTTDAVPDDKPSTVVKSVPDVVVKPSPSLPFRKLVIVQIRIGVSEIESRSVRSS